MIKLAQVLILLTIFLLPIITNSDLGYEQTKVIFFYIMTSITGLFWLTLLNKKQVHIKWSKVNILALIFLLTLAVTSFFGLDPLRSFLGRQPYLQGWFLYLYLWLFFLIISTVQIPIRYLINVLVISALVVSLVAIKQGFELYILHLDIPNYAGRIVSTFGQPNLYAGFLLLTLPLLKLTSLRSFWPVFALAIVLSFSRAAILILSVFIIWQLLSKLPNKKIIIFFLTIAILITVTFSIYNSTGLFWSEVIAPQTNFWLKYNSPEKRALIWPIFLDLVAKRPIFGYGLENITLSFSNYFKEIDFNSVTNPTYHGLKNLFIDRSHNYLLDLLLFSGIFGTFSWLILFGSVFKKSKPIFKISLVIYLMWVQLQPQGFIQLLYFWLIAGVTESLDSAT